MRLNNPVMLTLNSQVEVITKTDGEASGSVRIKGFANTTTKDRAGDVIPRSAWEGASAMKNFEKNPIILYQHDHSKPIGKMTGYEISDMGLQIEAEINSKANPGIASLIEDGTLKSFSVGFRCLDAEYKRESDTYLIKELELLEVSVVSIPCNQDSTFELAKCMDGREYENFKKQLHNEASPKNRQESDDSIIDTLALALGVTSEPVNDPIETLAAELGL